MRKKSSQNQLTKTKTSEQKLQRQQFFAQFFQYLGNSLLSQYVTEVEIKLKLKFK